MASSSHPTASPRIKRRRRAALPLPSLHPDHSLANDAAEALAQAHLNRLIDRVRHALPSMSEMVNVCRRFRFNGTALPPHIRPENCWWFIHGEDDAPAIYQSRPSSGPPRGVRRTCYTYESVALGSIFHINWQDITAATVLQIFHSWNHQSTLRTSGLDAILAECTSRSRASEEGSSLTLHIWGLSVLAQGHVEREMEAAHAWQMTYDPQGKAVLPPWRIPDHCIVPMTEHEVQLLLRRPMLSYTLKVIHALHVSGRWEEIADIVWHGPTTEQEEKSPEDGNEHFHDDGSILSDVTPDASHISI